MYMYKIIFNLYATALFSLAFSFVIIMFGISLSLFGFRIDLIEEFINPICSLAIIICLPIVMFLRPTSGDKKSKSYQKRFARVSIISVSLIVMLIPFVFIFGSMAINNDYSTLGWVLLPIIPVYFIAAPIVAFLVIRLVLNDISNFKDIKKISS